MDGGVGEEMRKGQGEREREEREKSRWRQGEVGLI